MGRLPWCGQPLPSLRERQIISENLLDRLQSTAETTAAACTAALVGIEAARAAVEVASPSPGSYQGSVSVKG